MAKTWFRKGRKRKMTFSAWGNETEIDFVPVEKGNRKYLRDMKVIPGRVSRGDSLLTLFHVSFSTGGWSWIWLRRR